MSRVVFLLASENDVVPGVAAPAWRCNCHVGGSYFTRILRLSFLAPDVVTAILRDRHPIELTAKRLVNEVLLPIDWNDQNALLGTD